MAWQTADFGCDTAKVAPKKPLWRFGLSTRKVIDQTKCIRAQNGIKVNASMDILAFWYPVKGVYNEEKDCLLLKFGFLEFKPLLQIS